MSTRIVNRGGQITFERTGEDLSHHTDDELQTMLVARKEAVTAAQEWSSMAFKALIATAKRRKIVDERMLGQVFTTAVGVDVKNPNVPSDATQMQTAYDQALHDESAAKVALSSVRAELKRRDALARDTANAERHAKLAEQREAAREAALRAAVTAVAKPSLRDRVDALIGR